MSQHLILPENHFFLTVENDVRSICNPILEPMGITFFDFIRVYDNGLYGVLSNNNKIIKYLFNERLPVVAPVQSDIIRSNFNYLILPVGTYVKVVHDMRIYFNTSYFINIVEQHSGYFDLYCFGSTADNEEIVNFYLNNLDALEKFKFFFKETVEDLIKTCDKNLFLLPNSMLPSFKGISEPKNKTQKNKQLSDAGKNIFLTTEYQHVQFSDRQLACLTQLISGRTAKETARQLGLSFRTIEHYLQNIKRKLGCYRKSEIIEILLKHSSKKFIDNLYQK